MIPLHPLAHRIQQRQDFPLLTLKAPITRQVCDSAPMRLGRLHGVPRPGEQREQLRSGRLCHATDPILPVADVLRG